MGLILDTSVLIAGERRRETATQVMERLLATVGEVEVALSVITIAELTHGIYRARTEEDRERRQKFCDELCRRMIVHSVSLEVAQLAGRIEGQQAAKGIVIAFEDLLIGATALHLGFGVATHNVRHFQLIPGLDIVAP